nr:hypothetical protein [Bacillota bacterium]
MEELGRTLRQAREDRGLSLREIARETKIPVRHLEALESGDLASLPGPVYAKAFLRHYARAVGLDPDQLFEEFAQKLAVLEQAAAPAPAPFPVSTRRMRVRRYRRRSARGYRRAAILVTVLLAAAIVYAWGSQRLPEESWDALRERLAGAGPAKETSAPPAAGPAPASTGDLAALPPAEEEAGGSEGGEHGSADPVDGLGGAMGPRDGSPLGGAGEDTAGVGEDSGEDAQEGVPEGAGVLPAPGEEVALAAVVLEVDVVERCWFDVFADGSRIFRGTLEGGTRVTWTAQEVLTVRFGRPEGVFLTLNGVPLGRAGTGVITREFRREAGERED